LPLTNEHDVEEARKQNCQQGFANGSQKVENQLNTGQIGGEGQDDSIQKDGADVVESIGSFYLLALAQHVELTVYS